MLSSNKDINNKGKAEMRSPSLSDHNIKLVNTTIDHTGGIISS